MVAIITGGSIGIGRGCAEVFTEVGASVVICGRNAAVGEKTAKEITERGYGVCPFFRADVSKEAQVKALVDFTVMRNIRRRSNGGAGADTPGKWAPPPSSLRLTTTDRD